MTQDPQDFVAYYRVSTGKQEQSGLGLDGQQAAVQAYAKAHGGAIIRAYTEVESGKRSDRPKLAEALSDCRASKSTLLIAKLDRLSRNVHFLSGLMEAGVDFVCCDQPSANRLTLHILSAVAEDEAKRISERTRAALAAAKARGQVLGSRRPGAFRLTGGRNEKAAGRAGQVARENADRAYTHIAGQVVEWHKAGLTSGQIASRLNAEGRTTRRGRAWYPLQVRRLLCRLKAS